MNEEVKRLIEEDNVEELSNILKSNDILRTNFNSFRTISKCKINLIQERKPFLLFAVQENRQKVVEYLLSQDFVDKTISILPQGDTIYHVICSIKGAEQLFSIIERNVPHHLLYDNPRVKIDGINAFHIACEMNNVFIVKRVHEILQTLQLDLTEIKNTTMNHAIKNNDIDVIKYVLSIDGVQLNDDILLSAITYLKFEIVVYILNVYICQYIPSHLHDQYHIFQFSNHSPFNHKNNIVNNNENINNDNNNNNKHEIKEEFNSKTHKRDRDDHNDFINHNKNIKLSHHHYLHTYHNNNCKNIYSTNVYFLKLVEYRFKKIIGSDRIWRGVCSNKDIDVVQLIFSLKGIQPDLLIDYKGYNPFLLACENNPNIKVIKYIHKLFPPFIHSHITFKERAIDGYFLILKNHHLQFTDKLNIFHYLYLNGIDVHFLSKKILFNRTVYHSIYSLFKLFFNDDEDMEQYLKVISQDFDYINNEHDHKAYRKPSFWKEIHNNNNNNNNNNNINIEEQKRRINEWKNRFDEHVLHHLSIMIQEWMLDLDPNQYNDLIGYDDND